MVKHAGISHVFAGHYHRNAYANDNTLEMVTTGPVGRPLCDDPSGIRIVHVAGDAITHTYSPLRLIPNSL